MPLLQHWWEWSPRSPEGGSDLGLCHCPMPPGILVFGNSHPDLYLALYWSVTIWEQTLILTPLAGPSLDHQVCQEVAECPGGIYSQGCDFFLLLEVVSLRSPRLWAHPLGLYQLPLCLAAVLASRTRDSSPHPTRGVQEHIYIPGVKLPLSEMPPPLSSFPAHNLTVGITEINEDPPNEDQQRLLTQSWLKAKDSASTCIWQRLKSRQ